MTAYAITAGMKGDLLICKNTKFLMQLLFALILVIIGLYLACINIAHAIQNIEPRQSIEQKRSDELSNFKKEQISNKSQHENAIPATQKELYEGGFIARDILVDGIECMEKQDKIIWCQPQ